MLELVERHSTGKARLRRMLDEIAAADWCERSLYLTAASLQARMDSVGRNRPRDMRHAPGRQDAGRQITGRQGDDALRFVLQTVGASDTGLALFSGAGRAAAVCPPFPLPDDISRSGFAPSPLLRALDAERVVGVVLLRLGRYAVGVLRGEKLVASKTAGRYMKNRHRAGGQSQRRFERSRERLIRELYDKTCETAQTIFAPHAASMDYILLGGENSTLNGFTERCPALQGMGAQILARRLAVDTPNQKALQNIAFEAWKSRTYLFQSVLLDEETTGDAPADDA